MWTVIAGGVTDPAKARDLRQRMAALLADPDAGTSMSSWRDDEHHDHGLHLRPLEDDREPVGAAAV